MGSRTENMPLVLGNMNRNGTESSIGESKTHGKRAGKENRKAYHYKSQ